MAKHRRYPVKKAKKLKSKDPIQRMQRDTTNKRQKNCVPKRDELDDQKLPRKWLDIQEASKEAAKRTRSGKKRSKNKFFEMTAKMGFKKRPWENDNMLASRIIRHKNRAIDDELIKVKAGTAGRTVVELDEDFKKLDEMEKRKKLAKIAVAEKRRKMQEKEERFRESQLAKHADFDDFNEEDEMEADEDQDFNDDEEAADRGDETFNEMEQSQSQVMRKSTTDFQRKKQEPDPEHKRRLTSSEKLRQKKKASSEESKRFLMLNAREIIPFGERVDAPPKFTSFKKTLDPLFSQAGKKDLLLKSMLKSDNKNLYSGQQSTDGKVDEVERLRTIEAYRALKKTKH